MFSTSNISQNPVHVFKNTRFIEVDVAKLPLQYPDFVRMHKGMEVVIQHTVTVQELLVGFRCKLISYLIFLVN